MQLFRITSHVQGDPTPLSAMYVGDPERAFEIAVYLSAAIGQREYRISKVWDEPIVFKS